MKGCLFLQRKFAPIGHQLAIYLRERGVKDFCAYAHPRTAYNFLKTQKDIEVVGEAKNGIEAVERKYFIIKFFGFGKFSRLAKRKSKSV